MGEGDVVYYWILGLELAQLLFIFPVINGFLI